MFPQFFIPGFYFPPKKVQKTFPKGGFFCLAWALEWWISNEQHPKEKIPNFRCKVAKQGEFYSTSPQQKLAAVTTWKSPLWNGTWSEANKPSWLWSFTKAGWFFGGWTHCYQPFFWGGHESIDAPKKIPMATKKLHFRHKKPHPSSSII